MLNILCIDDDNEFLVHLQLTLEEHHKIWTATDLESGVEIIKMKPIDLVLLDIRLGKVDGIEVLKTLKKKHPSIPVIMLTALKDTKIVVNAIREGASDYICKPFETDELLSILSKIEETKSLKEHNQALIATLNNNYIDIPMVGKSRQFRELIELASMVKGHNANVLIEGETGTGKELLALYIRKLEENINRPFITVNCAAIPKELIESELFGHERGSFTNAVSRKIGKFELANGGDIFLDEIGSLHPSLQAKVLRVLQEKSFSRIGGNEQIYSEFRVIAATNTNLEKMVEENTFRMDLFHRLRVVYLRIPSLKERREDIPDLVDIFLDKHTKGHVRKTLSSDATQALVNYDWPGNIRELENLIHSLVIMSQSDVITLDQLPSWLTMKQSNGVAGSLTKNFLNLNEMSEVTYKEFIKRAERLFIEQALKLHKGNRQETATKLNMARSTFYVKLRELGIEDSTDD